jgi:hypothetical protein
MGKKIQLTARKKVSVPCPRCGAPSGKRCELFSGMGKRNEPHIESYFQTRVAINMRLRYFSIESPSLKGGKNLYLAIFSSRRVNGS